jgi:cyclohexadienyl dehydratase
VAEAPRLPAADVAPSTSTRTLRIGIPATDYPPFRVADGGFSRELGARIALDLGFADLEWVPFQWPELADDMDAGAFDLALGGITWRADREIAAPMSRALASFGPCLVGDEDGRRLAVNRGGFLEGWARERYPERELVTVEDNATLPQTLTSGRADAFVTDSFEAPHFARAEDSVHCEHATYRKVVWLASPRLLADVDAWIERNEPGLRELRAQYFGAPLPRDGLDHLLDLIARRLALMPAVAAWKVAHDAPIEDLEQERRVLTATREQARRHGIDPDSAETLFRLLVELAKRVQREQPASASRFELETELRPAIAQLGERIVAALTQVLPIAPAELEGPARWAPLEPWTTAAERSELRRALASVRTSAHEPSSAVH